MTAVRPIMSGSNMTLYEEIRALRCTSAENVRELYGELGVDIYNGKIPTILSDTDKKRTKSLIYRIIKWWSGIGILDYEQSDRLRDVILKYGYNKKGGLVKDINRIFGSRGVAELETMSRMGYIII